MLYIRKLFTQDLRDGKQIAFPKEPSNSFLAFDFANNEPDRKVSFIFRAKFEQFEEFDGKIITSRLYAAGSESRMDGEVKAFIRDELYAEVDDLLIFKNRGSKHSEFEFMFVPKKNPYYSLLINLCGGDNHSIYNYDDQQRETPRASKVALQQIFYGAPGTGKSNTIKCEVDDKGLPNIRTTFHPDTDYSTFVGAYKPTSIDVPVMTVIGTKAVPVENSDGTPRMEKKIVYEFVPQAFLKAYAEAWKNQDEPFFLIIEEINRGNCAQIFGDLFQLLDRNDETGLSDYPISPDEDIRKFLQTDKKYGFAALTEEQKAAIPEKVLSGEWMILPGNLHIWATMNTSDQSLFPIDSAFKRRWDWQYMPISDGGKGWQIEAHGKRYDWWEFVLKINNKIGFTTNSEDKKLGYYFCKAKNGVIDAETFVGKVFFYIWNDVFKDFAEEAGDLFKDTSDTENPLLSFNKFYTVGLDGKTKVVEDKVELFLQNLGVEQIDALDSNFDNENDENDNEKVRLTVKFPNGELIACETKFDSYIAALRKIGLERVEQVAAEKKYQRHGCALISRSEEQGILDATDYSYIQEQGFYIVKGINGRTMRNMLNLLSQRLNLQLEVVYE